MERLKRVQINLPLYWLGCLWLKVTGWKMEGTFPKELKKAVLVVAHHTSNWDFPIGLAISFKMRIAPFWMGKHTIFTGRFGGFMKWLGGVPIQRTKASNVVDQIVDVFNNNDEFVVVITPEGTRSKVNHWKAGFYRIATAANVPVVCGFLDYKRKVGGFGPVINLTNYIEEDMLKLRDFYDTVTAKFPEKVGKMELKLRGGKS